MFNFKFTKYNVKYWNYCTWKFVVLYCKTNDASSWYGQQILPHGVRYCIAGESRRRLGICRGCLWQKSTQCVVTKIAAVCLCSHDMNVRLPGNDCLFRCSCIIELVCHHHARHSYRQSKKIMFHVTNRSPEKWRGKRCGCSVWFGISYTTLFRINQNPYTVVSLYCTL